MRCLIRDPHFWCLFVISLVMPATFAQLPPGRDGYAFPPGGKAGSTVPVQLGGSDWTPDMQFFVHDTRVKLEVISKPGEILMPEPPYWFGIQSFTNDPRLPREVSARFVIPSDFPPGPVRWSAANANGGGSGGVFIVGNGKELAEMENRKGPQELQKLPITINGRLGRIEEVDRYHFRADHTGPVTCDLMARHLGSDFHGVIAIHDERGSNVADVVDSEGRDPILTFVAEKGRTYTVSVRDLDHRGYRNFTYRLALTAGPRVITAIPAAGKRGETRNVEFIGVGIASGQSKLESVTKSVSYPTDPKQMIFTYQMETPFGNAGVYHFQLTDHVELIEPATENVTERHLNVPCAVTGQIRHRGERDQYELAGKKGDAWEFLVQSREIGSSLDLSLLLIGPDGKQLVAKDDAGADGNIRIPFTLPSDGNYRIVIADHSGRQTSLDSVYRLAVTRSQRRFHLRTDGIVNIPIGGKAAFKIAVERDGGFQEPIALTFTGLPEGMKSPPNLVIPPTGNEFVVTLECPADAPALTTLAAITGTAKIGDRQHSQNVMGEYPGNLAPRNRSEHVEHRILVSTTLKPAFKAKAAEADGGRRIPRGSTHRSEILIERTDGFVGEIILDMAGNQQRHRQGIRGPSFNVPPGKSKADYPVFLPEWLETTRTSRIGLVAMAKMKDPKGTPRYVMTAVEGQITMSIEGALMKLSHSADELTAIAGQSFEVPLQLTRSPELSGPVMVELLVPDELKGIITAKALDWSSEKRNHSWTIHSKIDSRLIGLMSFTARATALRKGDPVVSETTFVVEFRSR
jgi:hypothetical protein